MLGKNIKVIDAALRLHNFIISRREGNCTTTEEFEGYAQESLEFLRDNPFEEIGVLNDSSVNDECGRLSRVEEANKTVGRSTRKNIKEILKLNGYKRTILSTGAAWNRDRFNRINLTT